MLSPTPQEWCHTSIELVGSVISLDTKKTRASRTLGNRADSVAKRKEGISPALNTYDHTMALARGGISWSSCLGQDAIA